MRTTWHNLRFQQAYLTQHFIATLFPSAFELCLLLDVTLKLSYISVLTWLENPEIQHMALSIGGTKYFAESFSKARVVSSCFSFHKQIRLGNGTLWIYKKDEGKNEYL